MSSYFNIISLAVFWNPGRFALQMTLEWRSEKPARAVRTNNAICRLEGEGTRIIPFCAALCYVALRIHYSATGVNTAFTR